MLWLLVSVGCLEYDLHGQDVPDVGTVPLDEQPATAPAPATDPEPPGPGPTEAAADPSEPVADAGPDQQITPLTEVMLDGLASHDPGGEDIVDMEWTLLARPPGSQAALDGVDRPEPSFFADLAGEYIFELTVMNESGVWDATPDEVVIESLPTEGFYVELSWDVDSDLDLHLLNGETGMWGNGDCTFCNMTPPWGAPGPADNPSLDWDAIRGYGPETITIEEPADGVYSINVHYYGENGNARCVGPCALSTATARVYVDSVLIGEFTTLLSEAQDRWVVAELSWPDATLTEINTMTTSPSSGCTLIFN